MTIVAFSLLGSFYFANKRHYFTYKYSLGLDFLCADVKISFFYVNLCLIS